MEPISPNWVKEGKTGIVLIVLHMDTIFCSCVALTLEKIL
jgi:hypothetical protein